VSKLTPHWLFIYFGKFENSITSSFVADYSRWAILKQHCGVTLKRREGVRYWEKTEVLKIVTAFLQILLISSTNPTTVHK